MIHKRIGFKCVICPTDRNCNYCSRYKDYIKKRNERLWKYGTLTKKDILRDIFITIVFAPVFIIYTTCWLMDAVIYYYHKFRGNI